MSIKGMICVDTRGIYCHQFRNSKVLELSKLDNRPRLILGNNSIEEFKILYPEFEKVMLWDKKVPAIELVQLAKEAQLNLFVIGGYFTFKAFHPFMEAVTILRSLENRDGKIHHEFDFYTWEITKVSGVNQESDSNKMWRVTELVKRPPRMYKRS